MANNIDKHQEMLETFIKQANELKDEGNELPMIVAALMSASAIYTTYVHAGNEGYLQESGITKVVNAFEKHVRQVQAYKMAQANNSDDKSNNDNETKSEHMK